MRAITTDFGPSLLDRLEVALRSYHEAADKVRSCRKPGPRIFPELLVTVNGSGRQFDQKIIGSLRGSQVGIDGYRHVVAGA